MNSQMDYTLRQIEITVRRLLRTHDQRPAERRPGFLEARRRLQVARARRLRQIQ